MDGRLESLKKNFINGWFPNNFEIFQRDDVPDLDRLLDILFAEALLIYKTSFPALGARVYSDFLVDTSLPTPLYLQDIDGRILKFLGIVSMDYTSLCARPDVSYTIAGRGVTNATIGVTSPYLAEQSAIDLYTRIDVDQWSGRMDKPVIMADEDDNEYIYPAMDNFIVMYIRERNISVDTISSSLYKSVEAWLTYMMASYVLDALGKYPLKLALDEISATEDELSPKKLSSVTISGKLSLGLSNSSDDSKDLSSLFSDGSSGKYIDRLKDIRDEAKKLFEILKNIRLHGIPT